VGEVIQVVLASVLRATTEKSRQLFGEEKCTPRQNPGYAYAKEQASSHVRITHLASGASLLPVRSCGTICCLYHDGTSRTDS